MADALLVSSSFLPGRGGIESHLAGLCALVAPRLAVLAPAERGGVPLPPRLGYPVHGHRGSMLVPSPAVLRAVVAAARHESTERVLFGTPWPLALLAHELRAHGLRYAVIVHGAELLVPAALPPIRRRLARALAGADLVLPVSAFTAAKVRDLLTGTGHAVPPMELLRAHVDLERFSPRARPEGRARLGLSDGTRAVLCLGRLVRRKGIHRMIAALPALARRVPDVMLVVAGSGPEEARLRRAARRCGAPVTFTGALSDADAPGVYAAADAFVLAVADRWWGLEPEGLGVVLLEAAACGVACVAGRSGGTPEAVVDGRTGYVVDARDRNELTAAVARILEDPSAAERMGRAGRSHVAEYFSRSSVPGALLDWLAR